MRVRPRLFRPAGTTSLRPFAARTASALLLAPLLLAGTAVPGMTAPADPAASDLPDARRAEADRAVTGTDRGEVAADLPDLPDGRYVVLLRDPAAATYDGGVDGLRATAVPDGARLRADSPAVRAYGTYLTGRQDEVTQQIGVEALATYTLTSNGFAADLTHEQAATLLTDPRVADVVPNEILHVADDTGPDTGAVGGIVTSTDYLGLSGEDGVWAAVGGVRKAGEGVVVGVIDTGIAPENPSFAGEPLGTEPGEAPYRDGDVIRFAKADGGTFTGECVPGVQFAADACSTKLVGARYYVDGFGRANIGAESDGEYLSPRDGGSHGSHTASTAAGNAGVQITSPAPATLSGVAPAARLAVYKACWSGPDPSGADDDGCATADLLAAIDDAVADGVDVINYSIGGAPGSTFSLTDQAFLAASAAGVFVAAAGGNAGPDESTVDNLGPWITTAAATTFPSSDATVRTGDGAAFPGASVTVPEDGLTGPFVAASATGLPGADESELCGPSSLDPEQVAGAVVLCLRGTYDRAAKSAEVARAGGIGMVLANSDANSLDLDAHSVPTVHVDAAALPALTAYAATGGATVTLERGDTTGQAAAPVPQVAGFSSRGPVPVDGGDLIKPDVAAPGVNVLAAGANAQGASSEYLFLSGTSMAAPHVAGLAAIYLGEHPLAPVAEVKSALMTTAVDTVDQDGAPAPDPSAQGNGQVRPASYLEPGLLYLAGLSDWTAYVQGSGAGDLGVDPVDPSDLNLPSVAVGGLAGTQTVTRTLTSAQAGTWTADVSGLAGVDVRVSPATLTFDAAGQARSVEITFSRQDAPLGALVTGYLTWAGESVPSVRNALAVRPVALDVPTEVAVTGTSGRATISASVGETATVPLTATGLAQGESSRATGTVGGDTHRYAVTVPEGTALMRLSLDAVDDGADLDLFAYQQDALGGLIRVADSATGSADEQIDLVAPAAGEYLIEVDFYAGGPRQAEHLGYTFTSYVLDKEASAGKFKVAPPVLHGKLGRVAKTTARWHKLAPGPYLGTVTFGDTGLSTLVTVDAGAARVAAATDPALRAGAEWVRSGADVRLTATGLAGGAEYQVFLDGTAAPLRTGSATAQGTLAWYVRLPGDVSPGGHTLTVRGAGTEASTAVKVSPVLVSSLWGYSVGAWDGTPRVQLNATYQGSGTVRTTITAADGGKVYLDTTDRLGGNPLLTSLQYESQRVPARSVDLVGTVTVVLPDGTPGPVTETEFVPEALEPSAVTFTPRADDADRLDVRTDNRSGSPLYPLVRYTLCSGDRIEAAGFADNGESTETYDLTGVTRVDLLAEGELVGTYDNHDGPHRCDSTGPKVAQHFWARMSAPEHPEDPARPITYEVSFRYAPYSGGFGLDIGEGPERYAQDPSLVEDIPTEIVTERGPVVSRTVTLPEDTPAWAVATYEAQTPVVHYQGLAWLETPGVRAAELRPAH